VRGVPRRRKGAFTPDGELVLLQDQDRSLWDRDLIQSAVGLLEEAARQRRTGPYQLQAAIVACHAEASSWLDTDWRQIVALYEMLLKMNWSPVVHLNYAIALAHVAGTEAALAEVDSLTDALDGYYLFHATRAEMLRELNLRTQAARATERALELTSNGAERALLQKRLATL